MSWYAVVVGVAIALGLPVSLALSHWPDGGLRATVRRRRVGNYPGLQLAHLTDAHPRPDGFADPWRWHLYEIGVPRPHAGQIIHEMRCPSCAEAMTFTVRSAQATRRRRLLWLTLAAVALAGVFYFVWWGVVNFDPHDGPRNLGTAVGLVGSLVAHASFADAWWDEDGVTLHNSQSRLRQWFKRPHAHMLRYGPGIPRITR